MPWPKGRPRTFSAEHRARISEALKGHETSPETREKIGAAFRGRKLSKAHRAKIGASQKGQRRGPRRPETCAKLSAALKGRKISPETRKKISEALKDRTFTPEHRRRISEAKKGHEVSPETRAKLSANRTDSIVVPATYAGRIKPILDELQAEESARSSAARGIPVKIGGRKTFVSSDEQARIIELLDRKPRRSYSLDEIGKRAGVKQPRKVLAKLLKHATVGALIDEELGDYGSKFYRVVEFRT
jgi:hypothetical protein